MLFYRNLNYLLLDSNRGAVPQRTSDNECIASALDRSIVSKLLIFYRVRQLVKLLRYDIGIQCLPPGNGCAYTYASRAFLSLLPMTKD